jgi:signal recognition particle subunit SRP54
MTGQDAVRSAGTFHEEVGLTGIVLTKMDGDARGGAALSIRHVTGVPVKLVGTGERLDALEPFRPDGMVSRILGMGDVLALVEKAEAVVDREEAERMRRKVARADLTFEDMLGQMKQLRRMGPLGSLLELLPGGSKLAGMEGLDERDMKHVEALILSMTPEERRNPSLLNPSRKRRIARGAGRPPEELTRLVNQFKQMKKLLRRLGGKGRRGMDPFAGLKPARR